MGISVDRSDQGSTTVFEIEGEMRTYATDFQNLRDAVLKALDEGQENIVLNMAKVRYADSTALGSMVGIHMDVRRHGGQLILCELVANLQSVVEKANLDRYFRIQPDVAQSLACFAEGIAS